MQRNRNIRKVIQEPKALEHNSNVYRRADKRTFVRKTHARPAQVATAKTIELVNAAQPEPSTVYYSRVEKIFEGETIYIIGGGPSLVNFDFRQLVGCKTIAINKAILFHRADVCYWTDGRFYTWFKNEVDNYTGLKYALKPGSQYTKDIQVLRKGKAYGLEKDPSTLAHGFNSGYAAINLAYHLGAKRIILLGYDMGNDGSLGHFHDGYPTRAVGDKIYKDKFMPSFKQLSVDMKKENVMVLNASPYSKLNVFPKITLEQALSFR